MKRTKISLQRLVVVLALLLFVVKFIAYFLTNSNAILTDALESTINVIASIFALYSLVLSGKPRDADHPYGHGKIEYISASIEGTMVTIAGIFIVIKSAYNLLFPTELGHLEVGMILIAFAGLGNFIVGKIITKKGHKEHSLTLVAGGKHLVSDAISSLGLLIGLGLILITEISWLDNPIAIIFGGYIIFMGIGILKHSIAGIMDQADFELMSSMITHLEKNRDENWIDVHNLRVIKYGSTLHVDCHITIPWYFSVKNGHDEIKKIEKLLRNFSERKIEFFIHADPCLPPSCNICLKSKCEERKHELREKISWKLENVMMNKKHK